MINSEYLRVKLEHFKSLRDEADKITDKDERYRRLEEVWAAENTFRNSEAIRVRIRALFSLGLAKSSYLFDTNVDSPNSIGAIYVVGDEVWFSDKDGVLTFTKDAFDTSDEEIERLKERELDIANGRMADVFGWETTVVYEVYKSLVEEEAFHVTKNLHRDAEALRFGSIELLDKQLRKKGWTRYGICLRGDNTPVDMWENEGEFIAAWLEPPAVVESDS